jgi:hypothetical protein
MTQCCIVLHFTLCIVKRYTTHDKHISKSIKHKHAYANKD